MRSGFSVGAFSRSLRRSKTRIPGLTALVVVFFTVQVALIAGFTLRRTNLVAPSFTIQLRSDALDRDIQEFLVGLRALPSVAHLEYVPREKALELERIAHPDAVAFLESMQFENPFHDAVVATLADLSVADSLTAFASDARWSRTVDPVFAARTASDRDAMATRLQYLNLARTASVVLVGFAVLTLFLLAADMMRRSALRRRDDLFVERMSGADDLAITLPFAVEMTFALGIAFLASIACTAILLLAASSVLPFMNEVEAVLREAGPAVAAAEAAGVLFLGFFAAALGLRKVSSSHGTLAFG